MNLQSYSTRVLFRAHLRVAYVLGIMGMLPMHSQAAACSDEAAFSTSTSITLATRAALYGKVRSLGGLQLGEDVKIMARTVVSGSVTMGERSFIADSLIYGSTLQKPSTATIQKGSVKRSTPSCAIILPSITWAAKSVLNAGDTIRPGAWTSLVVPYGVTVYAYPGAYQFGRFELQADAKFVIVGNGASTFQVDGAIVLGDRSKVMSFSDTLLAKTTRWQYTGTTTISVGYDAKLNGFVTAPNAGIILRDRALLNGGFAAGSALIGDDAKLVSIIIDTNIVGADPGSTGGDSIVIPAPRPCQAAPSLFAVDSFYVGDRSAIGGKFAAGMMLFAGYDATLMDTIWSNGLTVLRDRVTARRRLFHGGQLWTGYDVSLLEGDRVDSTRHCMDTLSTSFPGSLRRVVDWDRVDTLAPGQWGDVVVRSRATLRLRSGRYDLRSLVLEPDAKLQLVDTTITHVVLTDGLDWGDRVRVSFVNNGSDSTLALAFRLESKTGNDVVFGRDGKVVGQIHFSQARVFLGARTQYLGSFQARTIVLENDAVLQAYPDRPSSNTSVRIVRPDRRIWSNQLSLPVVWTVNGILQSTGTLETLRSTDGLHRIVRCKSNTCDSVLVLVDRTSPLVKISNFKNGQILEVPRQVVVWTVDGVERRDSIVLQPGWNAVERCVIDSAGNEGCDLVRLEFDPDRGRKVMFRPAPGLYRNSVSVSIECDDARAKDSIWVDGHLVTGAAQIGLGEHLVRASCTLPGIASLPYEGIYGVIPAGAPPEPVPTALDSAGVPVPWRDWRFLFRDTLGHKAVQESVSISFDPSRIAQIHGKVVDRSGRGLPWVKVSIVGHPEWGLTHTRSNGEWNMVVHSGEDLIVNFRLPAYLPAQRRVRLSPREFAAVPELAIIPHSSVARTLSFDGQNSSQLFMGEAVDDGDGMRQPLIFVPEKTTAILIGSKGDSITDSASVTHLSLRATEYTVGTMGQKALPGELPSAVAYAYAVELGADAAQVSGKRVRFSKPVSVYVSNFLRFSPGVSVPTGWYNFSKGAWIAHPNGIVVKVVGEANGSALLSVNGSGQVASNSQLNAWNFSSEELHKIREVYPVGSSFWRFQTNHLTGWDAGWGYNPVDSMWNGEILSDENDPAGCGTRKCELDVANGAVRERIPLAGSSEDLVYASERVPGRKGSRTLVIPVTGGNVPENLKRVEVTIAVDGKEQRYNFTNLPSQVVTWTWNGRDGFDRAVLGRREVSVKVAYTYSLSYQNTELYGSAGTTTASIEIDKGRGEVTRSVTRKAWVSMGSRRPDGLGGLTLERHHWYDPVAGIMHMGDGRQIRLRDDIGWLLVPNLWDSLGFANGFDVTQTGDILMPVYNTQDGAAAIYVLRNNGKSYFVPVDTPSHRTAGSDLFWVGDSTFWVAFAQGHANAGTTWGWDALYKYRLEQTGDSVGVRYLDSLRLDSLVCFAQTAGCVFSVNSGGANGLLVSSPIIGRVVHVDANGGQRILAGGDSVNPIDVVKGVAINPRRMKLVNPGFAVNCEAGVLISDEGSNRVFIIGKDGLVRLFAGNGDSKAYGDGGLAVDAGVPTPRGLWCDEKDGSVIIAGQRDPEDGNKENGNVLRKVDRFGYIRTLAGNAVAAGVEQRIVPASIARLMNPSSPIVLDNGEIMFLERVVIGSNKLGRISKLKRFGDWFADSLIVVPDPDGDLVHVFQENGRHLYTREIRTGRILRQFEYASDKTLSKVIGATPEDVLNISRTGNEIVLSARSGTTRIALDAAGWASDIIVDGAGLWSMSSESNGLLARYQAPGRPVALVTYDPMGRVRAVIKPNGDSAGLVKTERDSSTTWTMRSASGDVVSITRQALLDSLDRSRLRRSVTAGSRLVRDQVDELPATKTDSTGFGRKDSLELVADPVLGVGLFRGHRLWRKGLGGVPLWTRIDSVGSSNTWSIQWFEGWQSQASSGMRMDWKDSSGRQVAMARKGLRSGVWSLDSSFVPTRYAGLFADTFHVTRFDDGAIASVLSGRSAVRIGRGDVWDTVRTSTGTSYLVSHDGSKVMNLNGTDWSGPSCEPAGLVTRWVDAEGRLQQIQRGQDSVVYMRDSSGMLAKHSTAQWSATALESSSQGQRWATSDGVGLRWRRNGEVDTLVQVLPNQDSTRVIWSRTSPTKLTASIPGSGVGTIEWTSSLGGVDTLKFGTRTLGIYKRDAAGRVVVDSSPGRTLRRVTWSRDGMGIDSLWGLSGASTQMRWSRRLGYDSLGRIQTRGGGWIDSADSMRYSSDNKGRTTRIVSIASGVQTTYDQAWDGNGLKLPPVAWNIRADGSRTLDYAGTTWCFGANGLLVWKVASGGADTTRYTIDAAGRLRRVVQGASQYEYLLDPWGRRAGVRKSGQMLKGYLWMDDHRLLAEYLSYGTGPLGLKRLCIWGSQQTVPDWIWVVGGGLRKVVAESDGSVRGQLDSVGVRAQLVRYSSTGRASSSGSTYFLGWQGGLFDEYSGLLHFGSGDWIPEIGMWTDLSRSTGLASDPHPRLIRRLEGTP